MSVRGRAREERGLVGKLLAIWLALLALLGLAAFDTAQILLARYRVADAAQEASFQAASALRETGDRQAALEAALAAVVDRDEGARVARFSIDDQTGQVTVTVTKRASTLIARHLSFLKDLTKASATDTSEPAAT